MKGKQIDKKKILGISLLCVYMLLLGCAFSYAADLSELSNIRASIHAKGSRWVADETSVSRLSPAARKMRLGLFLPQAVPNKKGLSAQSLVETKQANALRAAALPGSLDWRNNGGNYVTPCGIRGIAAAAGHLPQQALLNRQPLLLIVLPVLI